MGLKIELNNIGINYSGNITDSKFFSEVGEKIHNTHNGVDWIMSEKVCLVFNEYMDEGNYGSIALCTRRDMQTGEVTLVFAKVPHQFRTNKINLLWEACVQILVRNTLEKYGFNNGAPKVRDIFKLSDGRICYTMDIILGAKPLDTRLRGAFDKEFDYMIVESIIQVASMISILEIELGFNHRDLHAANLLCRPVTSVERKLIVWDENPNSTKMDNAKSFNRYEIQLNSAFEFTLIDFGFVCFGKCPKGCCPPFFLNRKIKGDDICPKPGRDMFLFLAFLLAEFNSKMKTSLLRYFKEWLDVKLGIELPLSVAEPGRGIYKFIKKYGLSADKWIYLIARHEKIRRIKGTNASKILYDLKRTL